MGLAVSSFAACSSATSAPMSVSASACFFSAKSTALSRAFLLLFAMFASRRAQSCPVPCVAAVGDPLVVMWAGATVGRKAVQCSRVVNPRGARVHESESFNYPVQPLVQVFHFERCWAPRSRQYGGARNDTHVPQLGL